MESLRHWEWCEELTVIQAALLMIGESPSEMQDTVESLSAEFRPDEYDAARAALTHAVRSGRLRATIQYQVSQYRDPIYDFVADCRNNEPDWQKTTILVDDLRTWLAGRGPRTGFFFPTATDAPDYLDPDHPRYAPKLAAAVNAWLAMGDETAIKGKNPKQDLKKWLRKNAANYKLSDQGGKPNETGIDECAKVANWQSKGGAPKTPGG